MEQRNGTPKLIIRDLSVTMGKKLILDHVNFEVEDGEFLSILGPSGCGKTTILRCLIGLLKPNTGTIHKDEVDITNFAPSKRGMGIVFQNYALFENMTVLRNVEYALRLDKSRKAESREIAMRMLRQVGLEEHANKRPHRLSGGQQQRVAIARTLALNPDVILFDEPMSALDVDTRMILRQELKDLQKQFGTTMIYITHDQEEAFAMSDRIMVMDNGVIRQIDTPDNIVKNPADDYVRRFVLHNLQLKIESLSRFSQSSSEGAEQQA
ncbi:MAG: ABC transporter ATP-binding protein [Oscillospiraceae bacterium]|nr:ABC transporter ATP-binding protein [Oscillospiraceae bacterium]MBQ8732148.1 ABC transporter ATP-binding protein [Oscillospiraceae bacterium]